MKNPIWQFSRAACFGAAVLAAGCAKKSSANETSAEQPAADTRGASEPSEARATLVASPAAEPGASTTPPAAAPAHAARPAVSIGHAKEMNTASLSPDKKVLFTMDDVSIRAWDVHSAKELKLLKSFEKNFTSFGRWLPAFSERNKWLIFPRVGRIHVFNYETLQELPTLDAERAPQLVHWDDRSNTGIYISAATSDYRVYEIKFSEGKWTQSEKSIVRLTSETSTPGQLNSITPLSGTRLLVDTQSGYFVLDRATWQASRPDLEPDRSGSTPERPHASFPSLSRELQLGAGPEGTILAWSRGYDEKRSHVIVQVLDAAKFSVLRSLQLETKIVYPTDVRSFEASTRTLWLRSFKELFRIDFDTLAVREKLAVAEATNLFSERAITGSYLQDVARLDDAGLWLITSENVTLKYDVNSKRTVDVFGEPIAEVTRLVTGPKGFDFLIGNGKSRAKRIRITAGGLEIATVSNNADGLAYASSGEILARGSRGTPRVEFIDDAFWKKASFALPDKGAQVRQATAQNVVFSADDSVVVMHSFAGVAALSMENGQVLLDEKLSGRSIHDSPNLVAISPDNRWVVAYDSDYTLYGYDLTKPAAERRQWKAPHRTPTSLVEFVDARTFLCLRNGRLEFCDASNGRTLVSHALPVFGMGRCSNLSLDKKLLAVGTEDIQIFDTATGQPLWKHRPESTVNTIAFFADPRYLITSHADNLLRLWDLAERRELCSLALFSSSDEWVLSTGDFRFDASEKGLDKMYVLRGTEVIPLESLFEQLYTPKLLSSLLTGAKLEQPKIDIQSLRAPPVVRLEFADGTRNLVVEDDAPNSTERDVARLRAIAESSETLLGEIRLYQNGKLLQTAAGSGLQLAQSFESKLVPGENVFRAVALNAQRVESKPAEVTITYRPKSTTSDGQSPSASGLQLHLLVVGVNTYKNPKYNLNYAVADATAVKERIESQTKAIFSALNVKFILNEGAQKEAITKAFKEISSKAGPRDVFVFYYAGHGVMTSDAKPEFFLVPHDVTQLYGADDTLRQRGLSSAELMDLSKAVRAQKQLFILDACQSAGALQSVAMRGAAEEKAIAQLARSTGTHWLTASGSEQFATEFEKLGHGAFTYALIEGLSGKADTGDGRVTVNELKAWLESQVPEITQKYKGTPQYPSSYGFGQDFPVAVISGK